MRDHPDMTKTDTCETQEMPGADPTSLTSHPSGSKVMTGLVILFLAFVFFRLSVNLPTFAKMHVGSYYRIGVIPWSDASGWVHGAEQVMAGDLIADFPARRPLYSLFLAGLFSFFGWNYVNIIFVQIFLFCLSICLAYLFLKKIQDRFAVLLFLTFLCLWRPMLQSHFMTENLGVLILIIGFA